MTAANNASQGIKSYSLKYSNYSGLMYRFLNNLKIVIGAFSVDLFKASPVILSVMCQHTDTAILTYRDDASFICPEYPHNCSVIILKFIRNSRNIKYSSNIHCLFSSLG